MGSPALLKELALILAAASSLILDLALPRFSSVLFDTYRDNRLIVDAGDATVPMEAAEGDTGTRFGDFGVKIGLTVETFGR